VVLYYFLDHKFSPRIYFYQSWGDKHKHLESIFFVKPQRIAKSAPHARELFIKHAKIYAGVCNLKCAKKFKREEFQTGFLDTPKILTS
jgi:hypothetical protein